MTLEDMKNLLSAVKVALECALIVVALIAMVRASNSNEAIEAWVKTLVSQPERTGNAIPDFNR